MTTISRWMDRLADRWARRAMSPGTPVGRRGSQAMADVSGEYVGEIGRPPADVWAHLATPSNHLGARDGFVLPGPGPERWCLLTDAAGALVGSIVEVVEREDGRRIVLRVVGGETTWLWDWGVAEADDPDPDPDDADPDPAADAGPRSLVRLTVTTAVRGPATGAAGLAFTLAAARAVTTADHLLTGAPPPPLREGEEARLRERAAAHECMGPLIRREIDVQVVVPLPVDEVWRGVLDASTYTVDAAPGERAGVVPGTPVGQPGEMRYLVCPLDDRLVVRLHEVVDVGPGQRLVLRHHSASHPTDSTTTVTPHPDGSAVRIVCEVLTHHEDALTFGAVRRALVAHLARLNTELVRRAAANAEPPLPEPPLPEPPSPESPSRASDSA